MCKKKYYMVIDTETATNYVFDLGFTVIDRKGNEIESGSFVISEFMTNPNAIGLIEDRFSGGKKCAQYYYSLFMNEGKFNVMTFETIRTIFNQIQKRYNAVVCAYNASFDKLHLDETANYFEFESFFDEAVQWVDIWGMALSTVCKSISFLRFCAEHKATTDKGNAKTGAEIVYRFITKDPDFAEAHTAYEDTKIESAIMTHIFKQKKKIAMIESVSPCFANEEWRTVRDLWQKFNA